MVLVHFCFDKVFYFLFSRDFFWVMLPLLDLCSCRVYDDEEEEWFRSMFANSKKEDAIQNQYEFFVQRMGGPPLYSQRKGYVFLHLDSSSFTINDVVQV